MSNPEADWPDPAQARALLQSGQYRRLAELAPRCLEAGLHSEAACRVAECVAMACAQAGRPDAAEQLLSGLARQEPGLLAHRLNLGVLYLRGGRSAEAAVLLRRCRAEVPGHPAILFNLGLAEFALGAYRAAAAALTSYLASSPDDPEARLFLARSLVELADHRAALRLIAGARFEGLTGLRERYELAQLYSALERPEAAETVLRGLIEQFPDETPARVNLAALRERANRPEEAQALLEAVPAVGRQLPHFALLAGRLALREGQASTTLEWLDQAAAAVSPAAPGSADERLLSEIEFERGRALDRLDRCQEAFQAFSAGNDLVRRYFRTQTGRVDEGGEVDWHRDAQELDAVVRRWSEPPSAVEQPVFLVGFPRSGTTLLDQMLDTHPRLQVMEERPVLDEVAAAAGTDPAALLGLDFGGREALRARYWRSVAEQVRRRPGTVLIDKNPLNLAHLQLGMMLFPRARWIFAIRHPCDVVFSCFSQNLRFTEVTRGFWSLEETARIYARLVGVWQQQRLRLQPLILDLRYEDLVDDPQREARRLCEWLAVDWDQRMLAFHQHARTRHIATPSYNQVIQPVYRSAVGRWLRYRQWFGEAEGVLAPFVNAFGYASLSPEAGRPDAVA